MDTWHIHIQGQVQGVGFRPFVYALAQKYGLNGWVNNASDGVHIEINSSKDTAYLLFNEIIKQPPILSRITHSEIIKTENKFFDKFEIIQSESYDSIRTLITPDSAMCADCLAELNTESDRRKNYAFITCTNCGPRYSISEVIPYDRENTTMDAFHMCPNCQSEYDNATDRRFYSQTNSCPQCAIELALIDAQKNKINKSQDEILNEVVSLWQAGKIIAIKGIGGYLLTCDASNESAVQELRERKHRPSKPFALMLPNESNIAGINFKESNLSELRSHISPIVLLKKEADFNLPDAVAPNLNYIGIMLPYAPLFELLLSRFEKPIVATSGNISSSPIFFRDEKAIDGLSQVADYFLSNNREIVVPQDDSVIKFSPFKNRKIILRRSRGLAPTYINPDIKWKTENVLAMGAMLKSTFSFLCRGNVYISQYLGDLESYETQGNYKHTIRHFLKLFKAQSEKIIVDQHPEYSSTQYGREKAKESEIEVVEFQHHIAHFGAVIGEHNLIESEEPVLGVIWDGTGLGEDGQVWGGEFFKYEKHAFSRINHFEYFDFILGDKMPKEPRISALSVCQKNPQAEKILKEKFSQTEWTIYSKLFGKKGNLKTSSVGRIFDAVASLVGVQDKQSFEGEAAMRLEDLAMNYFEKKGLKINESYVEGKDVEGIISVSGFISGIISDIIEGKEKEFIAAKFHFSMVDAMKRVAEKSGIKKIAFSGGVFQNGVLVDLIEHHLSPKYELYFHEQLSPNDENISFGQLICHHIKNLKPCV